MLPAHPTQPALKGLFVTWDKAFTPAELDQIVKLGDSLRLETAGTTPSTDGYAHGTRVTRVAWIGRENAPATLFARIEELVLAINAQIFRYDLSAVMNLQYTVYDDNEGSRFDWHQDYGVMGGMEPRKLTLSLQLSDPSDYDGCELQAQMGDHIDIASKERGTLLCFPSYVAHRVTPITRGTRKCLVIWAVGPEFR